GLPVHLVGFVENDQIPKYLAECHAVVLLSDHEGLGLALLEAWLAVSFLSLCEEHRVSPNSCGMMLRVFWQVTEVTTLWLRFGGCGKIRRFGSDWRAQPALTWKLSTLMRHAPLAGKSFSRNSLIGAVHR